MEPLVFGLCFTLLLDFSQQYHSKNYLRSAKHRRIYNDNFLEEKLIEQGQALEHLLKVVQKNEDVTKKLLDHFISRVEEPKLPEKVEPPPTPYTSSRRNFETTSLHPQQTKAVTKVSPWCTNAVLCKHKPEPVCGYDEKFGLGKFENICHMMHVNCYWKHNFTLKKCSPT